jgi:uracil permease
MFISNSGAFVVPVLAALAAGGYSAVAVGGITACIVYVIFALIFGFVDVNKLYKFMPKVLIGSITVVIGINLMGFITGYIGDTGNLGVVIAFVTVAAIALSSHYLKGTLSLFPFLIGTLVGYIVSIPFGLVDFSKF